VKRLAIQKSPSSDSSAGDDEDDTDKSVSKKGLPEKKRKRLLDSDTWERDGELVGTANILRRELGDKCFEATTTSEVLI
jgi:hypothetical protein